MLRNTKVQDCMTHPAMTVSAASSVRLAQQVMRDYHIRHLPVIKENKVVGILSSGDIRHASPSDATSLSVWEVRALWEQLRVEEVMSRSVITVTPDMPMLEAVRLLYEHRFNSLPVVDEAGRLVGIITEVDVYLLCLQASEELQPVPGSTEFPVAALP
ncbi:MAG: CBS domain-containing protein [Chloroflexota bacterium]